MMEHPFKRALRNSTLICLMVGLVVHLQGTTVVASLLTMVYTFAIILPSLWLSYHLIQKLANRHRSPDDAV
ncbi:MAG: hypothetical protein R3219_04530 [Hydrogenovibrio sp.]|nr:hypothetical protein [Hydrogenovibrio sp.]